MAREGEFDAYKKGEEDREELKSKALEFVYEVTRRMIPLRIPKLRLKDLDSDRTYF